MPETGILLPEHKERLQKMIAAGEAAGLPMGDLVSEFVDSLVSETVRVVRGEQAALRAQLAEARDLLEPAHDLAVADGDETLARAIDAFLRKEEKDG